MTIHEKALCAVIPTAYLVGSYSNHDAKLDTYQVLDQRTGKPLGPECSLASNAWKLAFETQIVIPKVSD